MEEFTVCIDNLAWPRGCPFISGLYYSFPLTGQFIVMLFTTKILFGLNLAWPVRPLCVIAGLSELLVAVSPPLLPRVQDSRRVCASTLAKDAPFDLHKFSKVCHPHCASALRKQTARTVLLERPMIGERSWKSGGKGKGCLMRDYQIQI